MNIPTPDILAVHVVLAAGRRFNDSPLSWRAVAGAIGPNARSVPLPWRSPGNQDELDITTANDRELASFAREILTSTGWNDEGLIVIHAGPSRKSGAPSAGDMSRPLNRMAEHARTFGADLDFRVHLLDMEENGPQAGHPPAILELGETVASAIGGSCRGRLSHSPDGDLARILQRTRFLRALGSAVQAGMASAGLRPLTPDAADALVQNYVATVEKNGFDVAFQNDDTIPILAPRIAAMAETP